MLNDRKQRLLRRLCQDVRLIRKETAEKLLRVGEGEEFDAARELADLVARDFLRRDRVLARVLPEMAEPVVRWQHGEPVPEMGPLAWRLEKRWDLKPEVVTVFRAGPAARRVFGGASAGGAINPAALSHDLACADLLATFAVAAPDRLRHWVSEDLRKNDLVHGEKLPDVILYADDLTPYLVCEIAGIYPKARLQAFHDFVANTLGLPYELW
jgi:hypothetical protein